MSINVLVTGANGQLAKTINTLFGDVNNAINFTFLTKTQLDITNINDVKNAFNKTNYHYCVNCAAYTNVEEAEEFSELAFKINAKGVKNIAEICKEKDVVLIHISTDYVFDGKKQEPYNELDTTNPINEYGKSKLLGEQHIQEILNKYFIIRTSWLYSLHGNNFLNTMISLSKDKLELNVVSDQYGSPTNTIDLANAIHKIIKSKNYNYGVYHFNNQDTTSWYDFAKAIFKIKQCNIKIHPIKSEFYPTKAKRPKNSSLDNSKIKTNLKITIPSWKTSLKNILLNENK